METTTDKPSRIGRYEVAGRIAKRPFEDGSEVFLAIDALRSGTAKVVALKRLAPSLTSSPAAVEGYLATANQVSKKLRHPNVVEIRATGNEGGDVFLLMDYLMGETLASVARRLSDRGESLDPALTAYVISEACGGLYAAYAADLVHGSLTPYDVFIGYDGAVRVFDIGIATARTQLGGGQLRDFELLSTSPDRVYNETIDRKSDVFSLGAILWELLTGFSPFEAPERAETIRAICDEPIKTPVEVSAKVPSQMSEIAMSALERDRGKRCPDAISLRRLLSDSISPSARADLDRLMARLFEQRAKDKKALVNRLASKSGNEKVDVSGFDFEDGLHPAAVRVRPSVVPPAIEREHEEDAAVEEKPETDAARPEEAKPEEAKPEEAKVEEAKVEEARVEEAKVEEAKVEEAKVEEAKVEEAKVEEAKAEELKPEEAAPPPAEEEVKGRAVTTASATTKIAAMRESAPFLDADAAVEEPVAPPPPPSPRAPPPPPPSSAKALANAKAPPPPPPPSSQATLDRSADSTRELAPPPPPPPSSQAFENDRSADSTRELVRPRPIPTPPDLAVDALLAAAPPSERASSGVLVDRAQPPPSYQPSSSAPMPASVPSSSREWQPTEEERPKTPNGTLLTILFFGGGAIAVVVFFLLSGPRAAETPVPRPALPAPAQSSSQLGSTSASAATADPPEIASAPSSTSSAAPLAPKKEEVIISVETIPARATIVVGGAKMGTSPMDLKVPKGTSPVAIEARHAGYLVGKGNVVPSGDQRLKLTLIPVRPAASGSARKPE